MPFAPVHRLIVIPERMIGINRNDCSRSIGTADRDGPERAVERTHRGWYFARTSRFGDMHAMKGPYSSERSVALMIARELLNEIIKRDAQTKLPG